MLDAPSFKVSIVEAYNINEFSYSKLIKIYTTFNELLICSDCSQCQKHRYHCCYDPKPFINKLDALIMDVNVMALRSRTKAGLQPKESHKMLKQINDSQSSSISPAKDTKTLMPIKTRKLSTNIDSFLFSLVPNKL